MFTFGNSAGGRLGRGQDDTSSAPKEVIRFHGDNQQDEIHGVKIGYVSHSTIIIHFLLLLLLLQVSCGDSYTIAISDDGVTVFGFGKGSNCSFGHNSLNQEIHTPTVSVYTVPVLVFIPFLSSGAISYNTTGSV